MRNENNRIPKIRVGYTFNELFPLIRDTMNAGVSVFLQGPPGIGKSTLAAALAKSMNKRLIDIRLAQKDPAELGGVYFPNKDTHILELFPPSWVKLACDEPCVIFLDEFNAAITKLHQAAAYQIVLERRIGDFQFHPDTVVLAAGNCEDDHAIVTQLSSALCNRFAHFRMRPDVSSWLQWAVQNDINDDIMAFVQATGEQALFQSSDDNAFASPRTWEMASRILKKSHSEDVSCIVAACVGKAMADRFCRFLEIYRRVNAEKIVSGKEKAKFGKNPEPSFVYAALFAVASYLAVHDIHDAFLPNIVNFICGKEIAPEYQFLFLRHVFHRANPLFNRLKALAAFRSLAANLVNLRASLYLE